MSNKLFALVIGFSIALAVAGCGKNGPTTPSATGTGSESAAVVPAAISNSLPAQAFIYKINNTARVPLTIWYTDNNRMLQTNTSALAWQKQVIITSGYYLSAQPAAQGNTPTPKVLSLYKGDSLRCAASGTGNDITLQGFAQ